MAKRHYIADSAILLPSSPMQCALSDGSGGSFMPDLGPMVGGISLLAITLTITISLARIARPDVMRRAGVA
ncbi:hypothetical protein ACVMII_001621 [Bradyrhizobium diazoefficiens]